MSKSENFSGYFGAAKEPTVKPEEILAELVPLINDYFVGEAEFDGDKITYKLLNGQTVCITAQAVN